MITLNAIPIVNSAFVVFIILSSYFAYIYQILKPYQISQKGILNTDPITCLVSPLIIHPTLIVHVNNKRCDCNTYCSRWTISVAIAILIVHMGNKRCTCNVYCHP